MTESSQQECQPVFLAGKNKEIILFQMVNACQNLALKLQKIYAGSMACNSVQQDIHIAQQLLQTVTKLATMLVRPVCYTIDCFDVASYGWEGFEEGKMCELHSMNGMVPIVVTSQHAALVDHCGDAQGSGTENLKAVVTVRRCQLSGCTKAPLFNFKGERGPRFCEQHRPAGSVHKNWSTCEHVGCTKYPSFFLEEEGHRKRKVCGQHKPKGMVNFKRAAQKRKCGTNNCSVWPRFNHPGEPQGIFCSEHKQKGMIDVIAKKCQHAKCVKHPYFNFAFEKVGIFCLQHKLEGMVNVLHRKCEHLSNEGGCCVWPIYNFSGEKRGRFCKKHRLDGMVPVGKRSCEQDGCTKRPSFFFSEGGETTRTTRRFCKLHKLTGMVASRRTRPKCAFRGGCAKVPYFNTKGEKRGRFCAQHKEQGMVDVKTKRCEHAAGCSKVPLFNFGGEQRGRFCNQHKGEGMVNVVLKKCEHAGCDKQPSFNFSGEKRRRFCLQHKLQGMVGVTMGGRKAMMLRRRLLEQQQL